MKKPIVALMYDFDKTLSKSDMQDYGFIPALGMTPAEFWGETCRFQKEAGVERILSYMYTMVRLAKEKGVKLTREKLNEMGKNIEFFDGVETWFKRINAYGKKCGVKVEHYLISSGTKEIVEGCKIAKEFKQIFGCEFYYDPKTKEPVWPRFAINYTQKTQYVYRIRKGALDLLDDVKINEKDTKHRIPYYNMIYLGDGITDIPCMQLIKNNGGRSIAIFQEHERKNMKKLLKDRRIHHASLGDYSAGSNLETLVKKIIEQIALTSELKKLRNELVAKELGQKFIVE